MSCSKSRNCLRKNEELRKGTWLMSGNNNFKAIFQDDGNFVVYQWKPIWASRTQNPSADRLVMQSDGNLVIYNTSNNPLWASGTNGQCCNCMCQLMDDGNLKVEHDGNAVWKSHRN